MKSCFFLLCFFVFFVSAIQVKNKVCREIPLLVKHKSLYKKCNMIIVHFFAAHFVALFVAIFVGISVCTFYRSSRPELFLRKDVLKIFSKFTGVHTCRSVISTTLLCNFMETTLWYEFSPVNLLHFF